MDEKNYFSVGDLQVSMDVQNGDIGDISATDPNGDTYEGEFVFLRLSGGKCMICRRINGTWQCQDISCGVVDVAPPSQERA